MLRLYRVLSKPEERVFRADMYTVNLGGQYHDDVRAPAPRIPWYNDAHSKRMNAVLQDPEDQNCI